MSFANYANIHSNLCQLHRSLGLSVLLPYPHSPSVCIHSVRQKRNKDINATCSVQGEGDSCLLLWLWKIKKIGTYLRADRVSRGAASCLPHFPEFTGASLVESEKFSDSHSSHLHFSSFTCPTGWTRGEQRLLWGPQYSGSTGSFALGFTTSRWRTTQEVFYCLWWGTIKEATGYFANCLVLFP